MKTSYPTTDHRQADKLPVLLLALERAVVPHRMPGYSRQLRSWLRLARALRIHRRHDDAIRHAYQDAALRSNEAADLERQEAEICGDYGRRTA